MAVGPVTAAGVSRACPKVGTQRFRKAPVAPDPKDKKLGGGARASPPHKTLAGFDIQLHYTRSEPAVDQLDEEDCSLLMGEVNSEIRGKDGWSCPSLRLLEAFGPDARALLDAFHIELIGPDRIVLEPACLVDLYRTEGKPALR